MRAGYLMLLLWALAPAVDGQEVQVKIGSKKFTESVILGEVVKHVAESTGRVAEHKAEMGGTRVLWNALLKGEIHVPAIHAVPIPACSRIAQTRLLRTSRHAAFAAPQLTIA